MLLHRQYISPSIRSLANHLDAALGACDLLLTAQGEAADPHNLLRLELTAIAHVLQAREDMRELSFADGSMRSQAALFLAATSCLEDATPSTPAAGLEAAATRLIGGRIDVAPLTGLISAMSNAIELSFLRPDDDTDASDNRPSPVTINESLVWATSSDYT